MADRVSHASARCFIDDHYRNTVSNELGGFDSDSGIFPWSSFELLSPFFLRPRIRLIIDDYRKKQWKHDIPLLQFNPRGSARRPRGNIRQITIVVFNLGGYPAEKATVHVHVVKEKRPLSQLLWQFVSGRHWEFPPDVKVAWDTKPDEVVFESDDESPNENDVARQVRQRILSSYTDTIDPRYEKVAVLAFAIQGHTNAYLTDEKTTPLPIGQNYELLISISGRKMQSTNPRLYRLSLKDWDHLSVERIRGYR